MAYMWRGHVSDVAVVLGLYGNGQPRHRHDQGERQRHAEESIADFVCSHEPRLRAREVSGKEQTGGFLTRAPCSFRRCDSYIRQSALLLGLKNCHKSVPARARVSGRERAQS